MDGTPAPSRREILTPRREVPLKIAIPATLTSDVPHLREKTTKIGLIGRAAAIFRVDEVLIYEDRPGEGEAELIEAVLTYMETPQYLRKHLFGLRPELRYAGVLPPLRTPHHPLRARAAELRPGEFRDGVVVKAVRKGCLVDVGVERPLLAPGLKAKPGTRMTFTIKRRGGRLLLERVEREDVPYYWGYRVEVVRNGLRELLLRGRREGALILCTSRLGRPIQEASSELEGALKLASEVLVVFGSPSEGLYDMARREGFELEGLCDFVLNTIPEQGVATVRTEEAVLATLALLNVSLLSVEHGG